MGIVFCIGFTLGYQGSYDGDVLLSVGLPSTFDKHQGIVGVDRFCAAQQIRMHKHLHAAATISIQTSLVRFLSQVHPAEGQVSTVPPMAPSCPRHTNKSPQFVHCKLQDKSEAFPQPSEAIKRSINPKPTNPEEQGFWAPPGVSVAALLLSFETGVCPYCLLHA